MGIRNQITNLMSNLRVLAVNTVVTRADFTPSNVPGWVYESLGYGAVSGSNAAGASRPAENVLMIYGCLVARRESMAKVPLRISLDDDTLVESGPLCDLMERPNQTMNWGQYVRVLETHNSLYNMMAVAKIGEPGALPDELIPLSPAYLLPEFGVHQPSGTAMVVRYHYNDPMTGAQRTFNPDDLLINVGYNPHAPLQPLSPLAVLRQTMNAELSARQQNLSLFTNNSVPQAVIQNKDRMTREQAEEVMNFVEARLRGVNNYGKLIATWGGLEFKTLGLSPKEMEYLAGLKFLRTDYYIVFRVPPAMIYEMMPVEMGQGNESTESQKIQWWEDVGLAELNLIADLHAPIANAYANSGRAGAGHRKLSRSERFALSRSHARQSRPATRKVWLWFDENAIPALVRHRLAKLDQQTKIVNLGYRPDDVNDYLDLGLPPHPDNIGRVAFALQPIGSDAPAPADPQVVTESDSGDGIMDCFARIEKLVRADHDKIRNRNQVAMDRFIKFCAPREKAAARKYSRYFLEQKGRVLDRMAKVDVTARAEHSVAETIVETIFPKDAENAALVARLAPLWSEHLRDGWDFLKSELGVASSSNPFAVDDPRIQAALKAREIQATKINDTTQDELRRIIGVSLEAGETTVEMGDRIAEYYAANCVGETSARPMTAANTQTAGLVNQGRQMAAEELGGLVKFWIHGSPNEPREAHLAAAEHYQENPIPVDEPFMVNGIEMMYPGDPSAPAAEVCNCTCMVAYRIKKEAA